MTVTSETNRWLYDGDGSTDTFAYANKIFSDSDLLVYVDSVLQTLTTDYTVTNAGEDDGGNVVFESGSIPAAGTDNVVIVRAVPYTQPSDFDPRKTLPPNSITTALDRLAIQAQQLKDGLDRAVHLAEADAGSGLELPLPADRASMFLGFDADGNFIAAAGTSADLGPVSAFINTLLDDASAAAARTTLGVAIGTDVLAPTGDGSALTGILIGHGVALTNGKLAWSVAGSALTVAVKTLAGTDPSSGNPVKIAIADGAGSVNIRSITAALSVTVSSGSTLGTSNSVPFRVWIGALDNAGTVELFAVNARSANDIVAPAEWSTVTTTSEGGAGGADSAQVPYSTSARTSKYFRWLGFADWDSGLAAAGTWSAGPTEAMLVDPATPRPGEPTGLRKRVAKTDSATVAITGGTFADATGISVAITPSSPCNLIRVRSDVAYGVTTGPKQFSAYIMRGSTVVEQADTASNRVRAAGVLSVESNNMTETMSLEAYDFPASVSAQTYKVQFTGGASENCYINRSNADTDTTAFARATSWITAEELMG